MRRTIKLGEKDVEMVANAMTPVIYKRVFHKDFLTESQKKDADLNIFQELGFVMARQATVSTREIMEETTLEQYYEWLEGFEAMDIIKSVNDIFEVYSAQNVSTSVSKKKQR